MKKPLISVLIVTCIAFVFWGFKSARVSVMKAANHECMMTSSLNTGSTGIIRQTHPTDKGVGPVKEVKLGPLDHKMATMGRRLFSSKCIVCHSLDHAVIGPALRNVTKRRTPEYVMNMILNPTNMEMKDPITKELHKKYRSMSMTNQRLSQTQARAILEYFRSVEK